MSDGVIIGYDGRARCAWAGAGDTSFSRYHDEVWGTRTYDESAMFEALTLGVFEARLSWSIVFGKRDSFRKAFHDFDVAKVAAMTGRDVDRLLQNNMAQRVLTIETTAGTPSRRGDPTSFTIDQLPSPAEVSVTIDGQDSIGWHVTGGDSIRLDLDIGDHEIRVAFPGGCSGHSSSRT